MSPTRLFITLMLLALTGCSTPVFGSSSHTVVITATPDPTTAPTLLAVPTITASALAPATSFADPRTEVWAAVTSPVIDPQSDAADPLPAGSVFLILHATVHNGATSEGYFNPIDFVVLDGNGRSYRETGSYPDRDGPELGFGPNDAHPGTARIAAAETKSGSLGYIIPLSTRSITVTWSDGRSLDPPSVLARYQLKP